MIKDFERIKTGFEECIRQDDRHGLLFSVNDRTLEELALKILTSPSNLNTYVRWSRAVPFFNQCGFSVKREDFEEYTYRYKKDSPEYFTSPIYEVFSYLANSPQQSFSLKDFL